MMRKFLAVLAVVACLSLPFAIWLYGQSVQERRATNADTTHALCVDNQKSWDATHALIAQIGEPSPTGNAITRLFIPPETPEYVRIILAQLAEPLTTAQKEDVRAPFYATQGDRPRCEKK